MTFMTLLKNSAGLPVLVAALWLGSAVAHADLGPQGADLNFNSYPEKNKTLDVQRETEPRRPNGRPRVGRKAAKKPVAVHEELTPEPVPPSVATPVTPIQSTGEISTATPTKSDTHLGIPELEVGLSIQPFQAGGQIALSGLQPYDVGSTVGLQPMGALDFAWLPWQYDPGQPIGLGFFASIGYSRAPVSLTGTSGGAVTGTELQSLKAQAGFSLGWQPSLASIYRLRLQAGGGQWNQIQSSDASYANSSAFEYFGSLGVYGDIHFLPRSAPELAAYIGYDYRTPLSTEPQEIVLQRNNFVAGLAGTFQ